MLLWAGSWHRRGLHTLSNGAYAGMTTIRNLILALCAIILTCPTFAMNGTLSAAELTSFPGAQGYGKFSQGGREGKIIVVTTLADAGAGSLRACMESQGARNCVFRVGGVIQLKTPIHVKSRNGYLSVLGQTAPGGGILITINQTNNDGKHTPMVIKDTSDVILRHVRVRPNFPNSVKNVDAITVENSARVYIDHVSGSWATDENFNAYGNTTDLSVAYSIFGEGLEKHSKCALLGSDPRHPQNITFWQNACVSNNDRNPDDNHYGKSCIDIVNNLFFNAKSEWGEIFSQFPGGTPISYVGNYFKAGPSTDKTTFAINWNSTDTIDAPRIYQHDNETWAPIEKSIVLVAPDTNQYIVASPPCPLSVDTVVPVRQAYENVVNLAGAFPRDAVDRRLIAGIGTRDMPGRGKILSDPGEVPRIEGGKAFADQDEDGMPDMIERRVGANPTLFDPWQDADGDGWSNFDEVMQVLSDEQIAGAALQ